MDKHYILEEIQRTAAANGGKPLGMQRFEKETGIRKSDWYGKHYRNWGAALQEAGFVANEFQCAFDEADLLKKYADLIRELGRFPVEADLRMKARADKTFPCHRVFSRLGSKAERVRRVIEYCKRQESFEDVLELCPAISVPMEKPSSTQPSSIEFGYVYLLKSGRYFKIGRTNAVGRRERELAIQLPQKALCLHTIQTDDPSGIEEYWHRRFTDKRKNGEWFALSTDDIAAFKRRKFM